MEPKAVITTLENLMRQVRAAERMNEVIASTLGTPSTTAEYLLIAQASTLDVAARWAHDIAEQLEHEAQSIRDSATVERSNRQEALREIQALRKREGNRENHN